MRYLFFNCVEETEFADGTKTGNLIIPKHLVDHWKKQIETPYSKLSEKEKESDREWAKKVQKIIAETPIYTEEVNPSLA